MSSAGNSLTYGGDHFYVVEYDQGPSRLLWDLRTNTYARIPPIDPVDAAGSDMDILVLSVTDEEKVVVNLTAID